MIFFIYSFLLLLLFLFFIKKNLYIKHLPLRIPEHFSQASGFSLVFCVFSLDKLGRSMPNLVRAPSMPSVPASANQRAPLSLLPNSLSFDSSVQLQPSSKTPQPFSF